MSVVRRVIPYSLLPLSLIACALASSPWLRAFPASVLAVPLFGAALLSVLLPVVVVGIGLRKLWLTALIDAIGFVFFAMLVGLQEMAGFGDLYSGLVHGPSQILTFALPLVSPRTLLVAPIALCWVSGAIIGECIGRGWQSVVPYVALLATFGLAYAGSARAITSSTDGRRYDTLFAGALLLTLLLLRAAQAWVEQDADAETTQPDGILPMRGLVIGTTLSVVIAVLAAAVVQDSSFSGPPTTPSRVPPIDQTRPFTPLAFVAGLRPDHGAAGADLFKVTVDRATSSYIPIADVDYYDGDGWSFDRTFRPSGGVIPAETDPQLRPAGPTVSQQYVIDRGPMTTVPWMPFLFRPQRVTGTAVNIDVGSGMIVPSSRLSADQQYLVRSAATSATFDTLPTTSLIATSAPPADTLVPAAISEPMATLVRTLSSEVKVQPTSQIAFLQALAQELRTKYHLIGDPTASSTPSPAPSTPRSTAPRSTAPRSTAPRSTARPTTKRPTTARPTTARPTTKRPTAKRTTASVHRFADIPVAAKPSTSAKARRTTAKSSKVAKATPSAKPSTTPASATPAEASSTQEEAPAGATSFATILGSIRSKNAAASPEQYSTFMALVARQIGVPARVVTGFRVESRKNSSTMSAGAHVVTAGDAYTWVEIPIRGRGWVVLDPSPLLSGKQNAEPRTGVSASATPSPTPTPAQNALVSGSNEGHAVAKPSKTPHASKPSVLWLIVTIVVVAAVLVVLVGLFLIARKRLRVRRRRRAGDPRRRLVGAWQESLDVLVESGLPDLTYLTSAEVARTIHEQFGGEPAAQAQYLGDSANAAIFSPTTWVGPQEADAAWRAQAVLRKSIRRRLSVRERMNASLRYHRTTHPRPLVGPSSWAAAARARATTPAPRGRHSTRERARRRRTH